ncbi:MAG TPA: RluA family pseudouridine synthase [Vicinamibacterales bacterium]|nr:RluA family pseudouridine synthase [Vicinamibacterales bacterium]
MVTDDEAGTRLDKFLAASGRLGSRARALAALGRGKVYLNSSEATPADASCRVAAGDRVRLWMDRPGSARPGPRIGEVRGLTIVYEDDVLLVVDKPPGLLSVPLERNPGIPSIYDRLEARFRSHGRRRPLVVHRIDQDTSGLVVFAKDAAVQAALHGQFRKRLTERLYDAVVYGRPEPAQGVWRDVLAWNSRALIQEQARPGQPGAQEAVCEDRTVEALRGATVLEIGLRTGRRNQIRIQAALRGHPLVGEKRYVYEAPVQPIRFPRTALHARRLAFRHPVEDRLVSFEAPRPADLAELIARLK